MDVATLDLAFARRTASGTDAAPGTALVMRRHSGPLRVQKALYPEGPAVCHAVIVHPPGGIVGGDQLTIAATIGAGAHALVTTPGATKWYRAEGAPRSVQRVHLQVGEHGICEWLPQESIYFDGVAASTELEVALASDARFVGQEITCLGRRASGERFASGQIAQRVHVRVNGRPVFIEQGRLDAGSTLMQAAIGMGGASVIATLIAVGPLGKRAQGLVEDCRAALAKQTADELAKVLGAELASDDSPAARLGVTRLASAGTDVLLVRYLGQSSEAARRALLQCWQVIRPTLLNVPATMPRIWNT